MAEYGHCECGCGQKTEIAAINRTDRGWIRGQPKKRVAGHGRRRHAITSFDYTVEDRGYESPCWIWRHATFSDGYGQTKLGDERYAHRAMWKQERGSLPRGHALELHHRCEVRKCVNPDHLEPMPSRDHSALRRKQFCIRGHDDWYVRSDGTRRCLTCKRMSARKSYAR